MNTPTAIDSASAAAPLPQAPVWVFGYGSLIYKVDFAYLQRETAQIRGWARRFWQGSHDHRGTPEAPGRVVTLVESPGSVISGVAYLVTPDVFAHLDHREKNGYRRIASALHFGDGRQLQGMVYVAAPDNPAFLGPAPTEAIARHIAASAGPSGSNRDYLLQLAVALRELRDDDAHVFDIERHLLDIADEALAA